MNITTLKTPWPSTPVVSFRYLCPICLSWVHWLSAGRVWGFQYLTWDLSANPKSQRRAISSPASAEIQILYSPACHCIHNPEWQCIPLGSEGAARTINNIFPPWWRVAVLSLARGWMSVVVNAQSCDLLWFERLCENVRYSSYTPPDLLFIQLGQTHLYWEPVQGSLHFTNPFRIKWTSCCAETPERHLHVFYLSHH